MYAEYVRMTHRSSSRVGVGTQVEVEVTHFYSITRTSSLVGCTKVKNHRTKQIGAVFGNLLGEHDTGLFHLQLWKFHS